MQRLAAWAVLLSLSLASTAQAESSPTAPPATASPTAETAAPAAEPAKPPEAPPAGPVATGSPEEQQLARSLNDGSRVDWWGTETSKYLVLWREQTLAKQFGTLVLLHSQHHNADWPGVIHALRMQLPPQGWSTASLSMPTVTQALLPAGKEKEKAAAATPSAPAPATTPENALPTTATEPTPTQTAAPVTTSPPTAEPTKSPTVESLPGDERIADALQHLNTQPGAKVLLVYHLAAETLLRAARNGKLQGYSAIVLVEPSFLTPDPADQKLLHEELALLPFATLDIGAERGDTKNAEYRKATASRSARKDYVQWRAPGALVNFIGTTDLLENRVRGWLHKEFELPPPDRR